MKTFDEKCYELLGRVPKGKVVSYKQIAEKLGCRAYHAVGKVMKTNYNKKVSCHRVVCSDGKIGGFNRGIKEKIRLLRKEGIEVVGGKISLKNYSYSFK